MPGPHRAQGTSRAGLVALFVNLACVLPPPANDPPAHRRESLRADCERGTATACTELGDVAYFDRGIAGVPVRESWARGCELGDPSACGRMGTVSLLADGGPGDGLAALNWYTQGCALDQVAQCTAAGALLLMRPFDDIPVDHVRARSLLEDACARNHGPACHHLAWMYEQGLGLEPDPRRALELFEHSCELGHGPGCRAVGVLHEQGVIDAPNTRTAAPYFQRACEYDVPTACFDLGRLHADDAAFDRSEVRRWWTRGCELAGVDSCASLGEAFGADTGVEVDGAKAAKYHDRACRLGGSLSCFFFAHYHALGFEDGVEDDELERMVERACILTSSFTLELMNITSCSNFSGRPILEPESAAKVEREISESVADLRGALEAFERACELGDGFACKSVASIHLYGMVEPADPTLAAKYFLQSCERKVAGACTALGRLHARFDGVGLNRRLSAPWSQRGCELGDPVGCRDLGEAFIEGNGVAPDPDRATEYLELACKLDPKTEGC